MKKLFVLLAILVALGLLGVGAAPAATGDLAGSVTFSQDCSSGIGVGIAYDGANLWYSCYDSASTPDLLRADPLTGVVDRTYDIGSGLGALAYDATRNVIWAGYGGGSASDNPIYMIQLDANKDVSGSSVAFNTNLPCDLDDGLAFDANGAGAADDVIYYSDDCVSSTIHVFDLTGLQVDSFSWAGSGCYNSGLAVGGSLLFQGSDGCSHVWVVDKSSLALAFDFSTAIAGDPNFRDEDLECDTHTFGPTQVMWSKEAYSPMRAEAFEIPAGTCGVGGQPPGTVAPLSVGYWKTHLAPGDKAGGPGPWTSDYLPQSLGSFVVATTAVATAVWNKMNCSNAPNSTNAAGCLAGQLLGVELNRARAGSDPCIDPTIAAANAFLVSIGYGDPSGTYNLSKADRATAINLAGALGKYNSGGGC